VVLATSIAETSLTIEGITVVIDSGLARLPRYEPANGLTRLETVRASRAAIDQRAGRAGRTAPGLAIRLWREQQTAALPAHTPAEIFSADLSHLALDLASWGVGDVGQLSWQDTPPTPAMNEARTLLVSLGALDASFRLTPHGEDLRALSQPPRIGHMLVEAARYGCEAKAALLALLLSERGLGGSNVDLETRLGQFAREKGPRVKSAKNLAHRLARDTRALAKKAPGGETLSPGAILSLAWPDRIAQRTGQISSRATSGAVRYRLANGSGAEMQEDHPLANAPWLVVADLTGRAGAARILSAVAIDLSEIEALHGKKIIVQENVTLHPETGRIKAVKSRKLGALKLGEVTITNPPPALIEKALVEAVRKHGVKQFNWPDAANSLRRRLDFLHHQNPGQWPNVSDASLLSGLDQWFLPFIGGKSGFKAFSPADLDNGLKLLVAWENHALIDQLAPCHFKTPAGSSFSLRYEAENVILAVRVQELYGLDQHPTIMGGKVPLLIELLSPAHRPVQLTRDLPGFWRGSWPDVRRDMRGRYPRHNWPENPLEAQATLRVKHPRGKTRQI
jgi:ATP-dependent helicase HrpB